jgi:hypothetical protein
VVVYTFDTVPRLSTQSVARGVCRQFADRHTRSVATMIAMCVPDATPNAEHT